MKDIIQKIQDYSLEEIMGERFGRYAKSIIQDRALPDVRDGLKPVQRRILYMMYLGKNTYDKKYKKSGETVGSVMGSLHPHGDSSIYDAMVRMSQWWKSNAPYVDMEGNNGSLDGDSAAAYRYTEARLSKISNELLKDLDKKTVKMAPNYSDTMLEPTVLPAKFPALLVNGASGISAGYATNIPPHNLEEVVEATIKRIDNPNCRLETIMDIVKGPDFPTGGIAEGIEGITDAFKTGRGKVILRSKYEIIKNKGIHQIVITEIPFDVNKALLVKKIDEIRMDKKIDGISEVRDESDLDNPETIVIDLKKDANKDLVINYLLKNTDLQISYNYNMVAIVNRRPMTLGIMDMLDAYIAHQKEIIIKRTEFDLAHAKTRMHIVEGLIKMLSILDDVIKTIRASKNRSDAITNLIEKYKFTQIQAEAIVNMQLYKLTNTDVTELQNEFETLKKIIAGLELILNDETVLKSRMKDELRAVKKEYAIPRRTVISESVTEIKIDATEMIAKEDTIVVVTNEGYLKRVSLRSYNKDEETLLKEGDYVTGIYKMNTLDTILLFTDLGNYLYIPVHEVPELKWKELGKHASNLIKIDAEESIIHSIPVYNFEDNSYITIFTKDGMVKRTLLSEFKVQRYSKPITSMKLKDKDKVVAVTDNVGDEVLIVTNNGLALRYNVEEISPVGLRASGVKAISLKSDFVVSAHIIKDDEFISIVTDKGTGKRIRISEFESTSRGRKGVLVVRDVKTNPYKVLETFVESNRAILSLQIDNNFVDIKITELPIADRYSTGTVISKKKIKDVFVKQTLVEEKKDDSKETAEQVEETSVEILDLENIDEKIMTIDDFLDDFKID